MPVRKGIAIGLMLAPLVAACQAPSLPPPAAEAPQPVAAMLAAPVPTTASGRPTFAQIGMASWYGPGFERHRTAAGDRFDTNRLTAAHRTLPLNTLVRVTDLANGRSVIVRINDRGPFFRGRIIDLSAAAARALGMKRDGLAQVRIDRLEETDARI